MQKMQKKIKENPRLVLSVPAVLCFITFILNLIAALKDGVIDSVELHQLSSTADGFETVLLVITMLALKGKKK